MLHTTEQSVDGNPTVPFQTEEAVSLQRPSLSAEFQPVARQTLRFQSTCADMFARSLCLLVAASSLVLTCSAIPSGSGHSPATRTAAFVAAGLPSSSAGFRTRTATCNVNMVAAGSNDAPAGTAQSYMKKIPAHLQGLAIRKQKHQEKDYGGKKDLSEEALKLKAIQAELDGDDEEEEDPVDYAMQIIDDIDTHRDSGAPIMRTYDLDIQDAEVLRTLKSKMAAEDFRKVFGRGVGDLL